MPNDEFQNSASPAASDQPLSSIDYPTGFYHELAPVHLNYVAAIHGLRGPDLAGEFHYCELGCGRGETSCILAACHPQGQFVGIDLSASHIEQAANLARAGELSNVRFILADIATLDARDLPAFDFITLHGLYSWVPEEVQRAILSLMDAKLKPGGLVYVSYNAMPAWGSVAPLRRYFIDAAQRLKGPVLEKMSKILEELQHLCDRGAVFFKENPVAASVLQRLRTADRRYIAHEYLSPTWNPLYFADVHEAMQRIGLEYVGHCSIFDNLIEISTPPEFIDYLRGIADPVRQEQMRDFILNRMFRRDVFRRPSRETSAGNREEALNHILFGMKAAPLEIPKTIRAYADKQLDVSGPLPERLKELLATSARSLDELHADAVLANFPRAELVQSLLLLSSDGYVSAFARRDSKPWDRPPTTIRAAPRINQVLLEQRQEGLPLALASPIAGTGIVLSPLEALLLRSLVTPAPIPWIWSQMQCRDVKMMSHGKTLETEAENLFAIGDAREQFQAKKLPKLAYLGLVEPIAP